MLDKIKTLREILLPDAIAAGIHIDEYIETYNDVERFDLLWNQITSKCKKATYRMDTYVQYYMLDLEVFKNYCLSNYELELTESMIETYNSYCKTYIEKTLDTLYKNQIFITNHPYLKVNGELKNDRSDWGDPSKLKTDDFIQRCKELCIDLESKVLALNGKKDLNELEEFIKEQITPVLRDDYQKETYFKEVSNRAWSFYLDPYRPFITYYNHCDINNFDQNVKNWEDKERIKKEFWNQFETLETYQHEHKSEYVFNQFKLFQIGTSIESYKECFIRFKNEVHEYFSSNAPKWKLKNKLVEQ